MDKDYVGFCILLSLLCECESSLRFRGSHYFHRPGPEPPVLKALLWPLSHGMVQLRLAQPSTFCSTLGEIGALEEKSGFRKVLSFHATYPIQQACLIVLLCLLPTPTPRLAIAATRTALEQLPSWAEAIPANCN